MANRTLSGTENNKDTKYYDLKYIQNAELSTDELEEKYEEIRTSYASMRDYFSTYVYPEYVQWYKDLLGYTWDRKLDLMKSGLMDKSNIKYPLIASVHHTYHSNTYDSATDIKAIPTSDKASSNTDSAQKLIDWGFSIAKADDHIKQMDFEATLVGPGFARVWFEMLDYDMSYKKWDKTNTFNYKRSNPRLDYIDIFKLCYDPQATDFYHAPKFYTQQMTWAKVEEMYYDFVKDITEEDRKEMVWGWTGTGSYWNEYDFSMVKQIKWFEDSKWPPQ